MRTIDNSLIEQMGASLFPGETLREVCPLCKAYHEKSFALTRLSDGSLAYMCHRASCGLKGYTGVLQPTPRIGTALPPKPSHKPFKEVLGPLPPPVVDLLHKKYQLEKWILEHSGVAWCEEKGMIAMPIYSASGNWIGITLKTIDQEKKRVLTYKFAEVPLMAWYGPDNLKTAHIVEDQLSAMKIAQEGYRAIALCGTYFDYGRAHTLSCHLEKLIFWLDYDAVSSSVKYAGDYGYMFQGGVVVRVTEQDPKDCDIGTIKNVLIQDSQATGV